MTPALVLGEQGEPTYRQRRMAWTLVALLSYALLVTLGILVLGPDPSSKSADLDLWPDVVSRASSEPSDRFLYLAWLSVGALAVLAAVLIARTVERPPVTRLRELGPAVLLIFVTVSTIVLIVPSTEPEDDWHGIAWAPLGIGFSLAVVMAIAYIIGGVTRIVVAVAAAVVGAVYFFAAAWQLSSSLRDPYHFGIVVEDVLRSASGKLPYIDFLPTYSSLLGLPLSALQGLDHLDMTQVATNWTLILQLVTVGLGFLLVIFALRRKMLGLAFLVFVGPVAFVQSGSGQSALQTVAIMPARTLLPILAAVALVAALSERFDMRVSRELAIGISGFVFGLGTINNLEFGATASFAAALVVALSSRSLCRRLRHLVAFVVGVVTPVALYVGYAAVFKSTNVVETSLLIPMTYAAAGFDLHPIQTTGPYLVFVGIAAISVFLGVVGLRIDSSIEFGRTAALVLSFTGLWSILSMFYFTGRSFSSVLIAGQGLQVAIMLSVLGGRLPVFARVVRVYGFAPQRVIALLISVIPVFISASLLISGGKPQAIFAYGLSGTPLTGQSADVTEAIDDLRKSGLWESEDQAETFVIYGNSAMIADALSIRDGARMLPGFTEVSRELMEYQCENMPSYRFLIVSRRIAAKMMETPNCRNVLGNDWSDRGGSADQRTTIFVGS